jgi:protein phosphatase
MKQKHPTLSSHSLTDKGLHRDSNEDCYLSDPQLGLWLVADGMGGHAAGEVASDITRSTIQGLSISEVSLEEAIHAAHRAVIDATTRGLGAEGMGSTVVALKTYSENNYQVSWVGDSRAYLWTSTTNGGQLEQLTIDHSYVQTLLDSGAITPAEVKDHPDKNIITQCIGLKGKSDIQVETILGQWHENQWILLCSDGLTSELDNTQIANILCQAPSSEIAINQLLHETLSKGARDNTTIQIIESPILAPINKEVDTSRLLPAVTPYNWLDNTLYTMAFISLIIIGFWIFKGN